MCYVSKICFHQSLDRADRLEIIPKQTLDGEISEVELPDRIHQDSDCNQNITENSTTIFLARVDKSHCHTRR